MSIKNQISKDSPWSMFEFKFCVEYPYMDTVIKKGSHFKTTSVDDNFYIFTGYLIGDTTIEDPINISFDDLDLFCELYSSDKPQDLINLPIIENSDAKYSNIINFTYYIENLMNLPMTANYSSIIDSFNFIDVESAKKNL